MEILRACCNGSILPLEGSGAVRIRRFQLSSMWCNRSILPPDGRGDVQIVHIRLRNSAKANTPGSYPGITGSNPVSAIYKGVYYVSKSHIWKTEY